MPSSPGPWDVVPVGLPAKQMAYTVVDANGDGLCMVTAEEDAKLIASAPGLAAKHSEGLTVVHDLVMAYDDLAAQLAEAAGIVRDVLDWTAEGPLHLDEDDRERLRAWLDRVDVAK